MNKTAYRNLKPKLIKLGFVDEFETLNGDHIFRKTKDDKFGWVITHDGSLVGGDISYDRRTASFHHSFIELDEQNMELRASSAKEVGTVPINL